MLMVMKEA
jgi:hypothetical protein